MHERGMLEWIGEGCRRWRGTGRCYGAGGEEMATSTLH
jgi:hypothetical protein